MLRSGEFIAGLDDKLGGQYKDHLVDQAGRILWTDNEGSIIALYDVMDKSIPDKVYKALGAIGYSPALIVTRQVEGQTDETV